MSLPRAELWERIRTFSIDEGQPALSFAERLARENGWTVDFAARVVAEYKKFIYLAVAAGHPVTPSDEVDQAWHLQLTYTRSYWERLCGELIGRPLHHGPTRGGDEEDAKYRGWYERTLESYRRIFANEPPGDIWPPTAARFDHPEAFQRIDTRAYWLIPRQPSKRVAVVASLVSMAAVMTGCGAVLLQSNTSVSSKAVIGIIAVVFAVLLIAVIVRMARRSDRSKGDEGCGGGIGSGCDAGGGCGASACGASGCGGGGGCGGGCSS